MGLKTGDLDLQGQIGLETKKIVWFNVNAKIFQPWVFYLQTWAVYWSSKGLGLF